MRRRAVLTIALAAALLPDPLAVAHAAPAARPASATIRIVSSHPRPVLAAKGPTILASTACASGDWSYRDQLGVEHPSVNYGVQIWDKDPEPNGDDLLVFGVTDGAGHFHLCFTQDDGEVSGTKQDIYVRFVSENTLWAVRDPATGEVYVGDTDVEPDVADGSDTQFTGLLPDDPTNKGAMRLLHAYDEANDVFSWQPGTCWKLGAPVCRQITILWSETANPPIGYDDDTNRINLPVEAPDVRTVVVHEIAHAIMDFVFDDVYPADSCVGHAVWGASSPECAWTEGFANWVAVAVYHTSLFTLADGTVANLETQSWTDGRPQKDVVEGRVAGALLDLTDSTPNELYWDPYSERRAGQHLEDVPKSCRQDLQGVLGLPCRRRVRQPDVRRPRRAVPEHHRLRLPRAAHQQRHTDPADADPAAQLPLHRHDRQVVGGRGPPVDRGGLRPRALRRPGHVGPAHQQRGRRLDHRLPRGELHPRPARGGRRLLPEGPPVRQHQRRVHRRAVAGHDHAGAGVVTARLAVGLEAGGRTRHGAHRRHHGDDLRHLPAGRRAVPDPVHQRPEDLGRVPVQGGPGQQRRRRRRHREIHLPRPRHRRRHLRRGPAQEVRRKRHLHPDPHLTDVRTIASLPIPED